MNTPSDLFNLSGKIALVTGASRGIGESVARTLAAYGAMVIVCSRNLEACEAVAASIREDGGKAQSRACHIGDVAQIELLYADIEATHGRLDILVNNAGVMPYFGPILDTGLVAFQKTLDVNVRGYFYSSVHAAKLMAQHGGGSIVNVASINGVTPGDQLGIYSISKAAVISMTQAFARECAPSGVRVNALLPGATKTKLAAGMLDDEKMLNGFLTRVPLKRMGDPQEMAGAVLYLASSASSYTTGACLPVDGGFLVN